MMELEFIDAKLHRVKCGTLYYVNLAKLGNHTSYAIPFL